MRSNVNHCARWALVFGILTTAWRPAAAQFPEVEPNETKTNATPIPPLTAGQFVTGQSTGNVTTPPGAPNTVDTFLLSTQTLPLGIYEHRLQISSQISGHTGTIRGLTQTGGVITAGSDASLQASSTATAPPRYNMWYGFGRGEQLYYRVTGTAATTQPYQCALQTTLITPSDIGTFTVDSLAGNLLTITTNGQGNTSDNEMIVYDANYMPIAGYLNDDTFGNQSSLTESFPPGTYRLALGIFNTCDNQPSPVSDNFRNGAVTDFPNLMVTSSVTTGQTINFAITDALGTTTFPAIHAQPYQIVWLTFHVVGLPVPFCNAPDGTVVTSQSPNQSNGYFSDGSCPQCTTGMQSMADNFRLTQPAALNSIRIWGGYFPGNAPYVPDDFGVIIHQDSGGSPGAPVFTQFNVPVNRALTGITLFGVSEYEYTLDIGPAPLPIGDYWLEVFNNGPGADSFFWETGAADPTGGLPGVAYAEQTPGGTWITFSNEMAMRICGQTSDAPTENVQAPGTTQAPLAQPGASETNRGSLGSGFTRGIQLFSGEATESVVDMRLRGRGLDLIWARSYGSRREHGSTMGQNWDHSYNIFITPDGADFILSDGNGRRDRYQPTGPNTWACRENFRELQFDGANYQLVFADRGAWHLQGFTGSATDGKLQRIVDRNGNSLQMSYDAGGRLISILDTLNHVFTINYAGGMVQSVTDFTGRGVVYQHSGDGDLMAVTSPPVLGTPTNNDFPAGKTVRYAYTAGLPHPSLNHNMIAIIDANGDVLVQNTYDPTLNPSDVSFDHVVRQSIGDPTDVIDIVYLRLVPGSDKKAIVNDAMGMVKEVFFDGMNRGIMEREFTGQADPDMPTTEVANRPGPPLRPGDPAFFETLYSYNVDSQVTLVVDPNLNQESFQYDAANPARRSQGNMIQHTWTPGPLGGDQPQITELMQYNDGRLGFNFPLSHIDGRGGVTQHFYDGQGNRVRTEHRIAGIVEDFEYNAFGQLTAHVMPPNDTGHRRRDESSYYAFGAGMGFVEQTTIDAGGLNITTRHEYDALGRQIRTIDPNGAASITVYNELDQVVRELSRETQPGIRIERLNWYDSRNNLVRTDAQNRDENGTLGANTHFSVIYEYDIRCNRVRQCEEIGAANLPNTQVTCSGLPAGQFIITDTQYNDNGMISLTRSGEAVAGAQPFNNVRTHYDERGLAYQVIAAEGDPAMTVTQYDYDGNRNVRRLVTGLNSSNPHITTNVYDGYDRVRGVTDPMGNVTQYVYDANFNVVRIRTDGEITDVPGGAGNVRQLEQISEYDAMDRSIVTRMAFFDVFTQAPIGDGESTTITDYDSVGHVRQITDDRGLVTRTTYDRANRVSVVTDPRGNTVRYVYDSRNNIVQIVETELSDLGSPPQQFVTQNVFDSLNRQIRSIDPSGAVTENGYDSRGNLVRIVDPTGFETRRAYNGTGQNTQTVRDMNGNGANAGDPADIVVTTTYDLNQRQVSQADDNGQASLSTYDALNRRVLTTLPDGTQSTVIYDVHGNAVQTTDANGSIVQTTYDLLSRPTLRTITPGPDVSNDTTFERYAYDCMSRMVLAEDNDALVTQRFDSLSRVTSETLNGITTTSMWDGVGNKLRLNHPDGRAIDYQYDGLSRVTSVAEGANTIGTYSYIGPRRVERRTLGNGTQTNYAYDPFGRRQISGTRNVRTSDNQVLDDRTYEYDTLGNKTRRGDVRTGGPMLSHEYTYDAASRLVRTVVRNSNNVIVRDQQYTLDGVGNREGVGGPINPTDPGSYNRNATLPEPGDRQVNQYTQTPFDNRQYDRNGNLIRQGLNGCIGGDVNNDGVINALDAQALVPPLLQQGTQPCADVNTDGSVDGDDIGPFENALAGGPTYGGPNIIVYDYRNRMVSFGNPLAHTQSVYAYDALGRRIRKTVDVDGAPVNTHYVYDGWQVIAETDTAGGPTRTSYVYGLYVDEVLTMRRCGAPTIISQGFSTPPSDWTTRGVAAQNGAGGGLMRLVRSGVQNTAGVAFHNSGLTSNDFEVAFDFRMSNLTGNASDGTGPAPDGLTMFVTNAPPAGTGGVGRDIGYGGGFPAQSFAVEFDVFQNPAYGDPSSNHVGVDLGGVVAGSGITADVTPDFDNGGIWRGRVAFESGQLRVYVTPPGGGESLALSTVIPGANIPATKYIGFSSGTGLNAADTDVDNVVITLFNDCNVNPAVDYYYLTDDNYNVVALANGGGGVVERYEYSDYGVPSFFDVFYTVELPFSMVGNNYLFQGREYDPETGYYNYRARYYDPRAGRFTTRATIGVWGDELGNGYTFLGNNPWSRLDPMGRGQWYARWWWWSWYRYQWWNWWCPWGWCGWHCYYWWWWYPWRWWLWWWWPFRWAGFHVWWWVPFGWWGWYPYRWSWWPYRWWSWWYPYRYWGYWYSWYWWWWPYQYWVWYPWGTCWWYWWYPRWVYWGHWYWWWWNPFRFYSAWWWWWYPQYWWGYYYCWWWGWWWPTRFGWCWWYGYGWYSWYWGYYWWWWYPYGWGGWWWWWYPYGWWGWWYGWWSWWWPFGWWGWWGCWGCWWWRWWWWWWFPCGWWWWWWWPWGWWWGWGRWWWHWWLWWCWWW